MRNIIWLLWIIVLGGMTPALTGCATGTAQVTRPGGQPYEITSMRQTMRPIVPLKACLEVGSIQMGTPDEILTYFSKWMLSIFREISIMAPDCDIAVKCDFTPRTRDLEIRELTGGKPLLSVHTDFNGMQAEAAKNRVIEELRKLFNEDSNLRSIAKRTGATGTMSASAVSPAARPAAAAPAPAPAGMTREEMGRIVAEAVKAAQAAAAGAAPAAVPPAARDASAEPSYRSTERPNDLAVIIGIEDYSDAPKAVYAERDAEAFRAHARALGVPERNIAFLKGSKAGKASFEKNIEVWLPRLAKTDSRVYFYFSGHGAPDVKTGQAYLVPWDGDPNFLEATAYPVKRLYEKLSALPAEKVVVALDACFSGAGGRSLVASGARPLVGKVDTGNAGRVTVLSASASNEISGSLDAEQHGAFTYFLLQGLNGAAKDGSGHVTVKSLHSYLTPRVQDEARRLNRDQTPQLSCADPGLILR